MSERASDVLLPSIFQLLKRVGASERDSTIDIAAISRQPVFHTEAWHKAISEFLRWSGSTLDVAGGASVYALLLGHGKAGTLALFRAYREYLLEHGGVFEEAHARLEAIRTVVNMASNWLHQIDWDIDETEDIQPEDFQPRSRERLMLELPAALSNRLKNAIYWIPGIGPMPDFVERAVAERVSELEEENGGPFPPRLGEASRVEVRRGAPEPPRTEKSFWKKPERPEKTATPPPSSARPKPPPKQF